MERTYIDIYCERIEPGLWAEPLNAITNLAFIIAAFLLIRMILRLMISLKSTVLLSSPMLSPRPNVKTPLTKCGTTWKWSLTGGPVNLASWAISISEIRSEHPVSSSPS